MNAQSARVVVDRQKREEFWREYHARYQQIMLWRALFWGLIFSIPVWVIIAFLAWKIL